MKLVYSEIKKLLPGLNVDAKTLQNDLTSIGLFVSEYLEIDNEVILDLEVRQNRGDYLGYYGIARDLSVLYSLDLHMPTLKPIVYGQDIIPITINSKDVYRIQSTKVSNINNSISPEWLQKFLRLHDINSINTLVDLTNYIMIIWGIPCHAFDNIKSKHLTWENNSQFSKFTSLDGTNLNLQPGNLVISDDSQVLSLSFIGGKNSGIDINTTESVIEMAIYNRSRVRSDSRSLKTITEASIRLDKELDTETIPLAFSHLISLVCTHCQAVVTGKLLDIYPQPPKPLSIEFDPIKPSTYAGINIPTNFSLDVIKHLKCVIASPKGARQSYQITPPSIRKDITLEEDLIEEVIRFYGYDNIPTDIPINNNPLPDITPPILNLIEELRDKLVALGYDEVRSWPLVRHCEEPCDNAISTQNSINSDYPVLRQSIIQSLKNQLDQYTRYKLPYPQFFEIGKIYFQQDDKYIEQYSLGIYHHDSVKLNTDLKKLKLDAKIDTNFAEINLENLPTLKSYTPRDITNNAVELTSQIITLDANVTADNSDPTTLINHYTNLIDPKILWSMEITDIFESKYTFRVCYYNCDDKTAKKIHLSTFNLSNTKYQYIDPKSETKLLYYDDMYQTECAANIINKITIDNNQYLVLDQTLFFPEGGGQPSDTGTINNEQVLNLKFKHGQVLHQIGTNNFEIGDQVNQKIDWNSRYKYMKIHSAGHLLHEVLTEINSSLVPIKGNHTDDAYLIYQGSISSQNIDLVESKFNQLVLDNLPILCDYTDIETLTKDAVSVPKNLPSNKKLRRLKIGNFPSMADGGIQVKSTIEIGQIKITSLDNTENQTKISYKLI